MTPPVFKLATPGLWRNASTNCAKAFPCVLIDHDKYNIFVAIYFELQMMEVCNNHPFYGYNHTYLTFRIRQVTNDRITYKLCRVMFHCQRV